MKESSFPEPECSPPGNRSSARGRRHVRAPAGETQEALERGGGKRRARDRAGAALAPTGRGRVTE